MTFFSGKSSRFIYIFLLFAALLPFVTPAAALFCGIIFAPAFKTLYPEFNKTASKYLLEFSIAGLGFGMELQSAPASGKNGLAFTVISICPVMTADWLLEKKLKLPESTFYRIFQRKQRYAAEAP